MENIACINYDMLTNVSESIFDFCDFNFRIQSNGLLNVAGSHTL